jgi:N-methylhydantoinase B/oxoprolinase/acetone carboxylase alpha subunit
LAYARGITPEKNQSENTNPQETATVIVFRKFMPYGVALGYKVKERDRVLTKVRTNSFNVLYLQPGITELSAKIATKAAVKLELKPGQTYFIQSSVGGGLFGKPTLKLLSEDELKRLAKKKFLKKRLKEYKIEI